MFLRNKDMLLPHQLLWSDMIMNQIIFIMILMKYCVIHCMALTESNGFVCVLGLFELKEDESNPTLCIGL